MPMMRNFFWAWNFVPRQATKVKRVDLTQRLMKCGIGAIINNDSLRQAWRARPSKNFHIQYLPRRGTRHSERKHCKSLQRK